MHSLDPLASIKQGQSYLTSYNWVFLKRFDMISYLFYVYLAQTQGENTYFKHNFHFFPCQAKTSFRFVKAKVSCGKKAEGWKYFSFPTWNLVEFVEVWFYLYSLQTLLKRGFYLLLKLLRLCLEKWSSWWSQGWSVQYNIYGEVWKICNWFFFK